MAWMLIAHVGATLAMTGLIWLIQCVHYPLFAQVGAEAFQEYHARHTQWITPIVGPLMLVELGTAFLASSNATGSLTHLANLGGPWAGHRDLGIHSSFANPSAQLSRSWARR